jgi:hypothetical protein
MKGVYNSYKLISRIHTDPNRLLGFFFSESIVIDTCRATSGLEEHAGS